MNIATVEHVSNHKLEKAVALTVAQFNNLARVTFQPVGKMHLKDGQQRARVANMYQALRRTGKR